MPAPAATLAPHDTSRTGEVEVSFVLPCLNEARTLEPCIRAAQKCLADHNLHGEVIVADNGSTDGSQTLATALGARVIDIPAKGYGNALIGGIAAARGRYIVMGDADDSYDFTEAWPMIQRLRDGCDLVMGNRFKGTIMPGAMPLKHKYLGNPVLTRIGRVFFRVPVGDFHCGLRAFSKSAFEQLDVRTAGMEFASELVIKAQTRGMRLAEVPVTLRKDGRDRPPHLRSWRDGWRHLRFMLTLSPRWTLFIPGAALTLIGLVLGALVATGPFRIAGIRLDIHTLIAASLLVLVGYQTMLTGAAMRIFALPGEIGPPSRRVQRTFNLFTLERGVIAGLLLSAAGLACLALPVATWVREHLGDLEPEKTLRPMIVGSVLLALGVQTILMSFVLNMLAQRR